MSIHAHTYIRACEYKYIYTHIQYGYIHHRCRWDQYPNNSFGISFRYISGAVCMLLRWTAQSLGNFGIKLPVWVGLQASSSCSSNIPLGPLKKMRVTYPSKTLLKKRSQAKRLHGVLLTRDDRECHVWISCCQLVKDVLAALARLVLGSELPSR